MDFLLIWRKQKHCPLWSRRQMCEEVLVGMTMGVCSRVRVGPGLLLSGLINCM